MSLIAEALKAAQDARSEPADRARQTATARRILAPAVRTGGGRRRALQMPKQLQVALAVFGVALATAAAVVVAAPSPGEQRLPGAAELAASPMLPRDVAVGERGNDGTPPGTQGTAARKEGTASINEAAPAIEGDPPAGDAGAAEGAESRTAPPVVGRSARRVSETPAATTPGEAAIAGTDLQAAPAATSGDPGSAAGRGGGGFELRMGALRASGPWFADALSAQRRRDFGAAIQLYERALQETPDNVEALNNLGTVYQASGNLAAARESFRRAITIQPGYAAAWSNLGVVLGALGELSQSQAALIEAIRLDPANHGARVNLALQYQKQGLPGEARRLLEEVVHNAPAMAEAHYALGRLLEQEAATDGAVRHYRLFLSTASGRFPPLEAAVRERIQQLGG